jgi:hypothetical protein
MLTVDWNALTINDGTTLVPFQNDLAWVFVNYDSYSGLIQIRECLETVYRRFLKVPANVPCPEVTNSYANLLPKQAVADALYKRFLAEKWVLTSRDGTRYQFDAKSGTLRQLTWASLILQKLLGK